MPPIDPDLLDTLITTRDNAYAPYSDFRVAAAIESPDGALFFGCNVEVAHYKSVCAEASAISAMVAAGRRRVHRVFILGSGSGPCAPCGACRQRLFEFGQADTVVVLLDEHGTVLAEHRLDDLLPAGFRLDPQRQVDE